MQQATVSARGAIHTARHPTRHVRVEVELPRASTLLHLLGGTTLGAIGLCTNNIQMEIASIEQPSTYFAIAAAVSGVAGALGTTAGGLVAELPGMSLGALFALSAAVRLFGLLPLILVREPRSLSLRSIVPTFGLFKFNRG